MHHFPNNQELRAALTQRRFHFAHRSIAEIYAEA
jgi:hypothetical protein